MNMMRINHQTKELESWLNLAETLSLLILSKLKGETYVKQISDKEKRCRCVIG